MLVVRYLSPIAAFKPINISDLDINVKLDPFANSLQRCNIVLGISMHSESLEFILKNTFGFDTLTVNGNFALKKFMTQGFQEQLEHLQLKI